MAKLNWTMTSLPFCSNKTFSNDSKDTPESWYHNPVNDSWAVGYGLGIFLIADTTVTATWSFLANLLVISAFFRDSKLRIIQNYYIVSLATSDFLMGSFVLPAGLYGFLYEELLPLQSLAFCKAWNTVDYICSLQSSLSVCLISYDRFRMVRYPVKYRNEETPRRAVLRIAASWTFSILFYGPVNLFWDIWQGCTRLQPGICEVEFDDVVWLTAVQAVVEFGCPLIIIVYCNLRLFLYIQGRRAKMLHMRQSVREPTSIEKASRRRQSFIVGPAAAGQAIADPRLAEMTEIRKEQKAARSLMILVGVYFTLWFWYEIVGNFVQPICPTCVSTELYQASYWPQYHIAALNPLIYAVTIDRFRHHFVLFFGYCLPCCFRRAVRRPSATRSTQVAPG